MVVARASTRSSSSSRSSMGRRARPKTHHCKLLAIHPSNLPAFVFHRTRRIYWDHFKLLSPSMSLPAFNYRLVKLLDHHNQMMNLCMSLPMFLDQQREIINHHYQLLTSTMFVLSYINSTKTPVI